MKFFVGSGEILDCARGSVDSLIDDDDADDGFVLATLVGADVWMGCGLRYLPLKNRIAPSRESCCELLWSWLLVRFFPPWFRLFFFAFFQMTSLLKTKFCRFDCPVDRLIDWFSGWSIDWSSGRSIDWFFRLYYNCIFRLIAWLMQFFRLFF